MDPQPVVREVKNAFQSGDLVPVDWLDHDRHRGANTYNECLILQMGINDAGGASRKAFLPRIYVLDASFHGGCAALQQIVGGTAEFGKLHQHIYSEYWHGYVLIGSLLTRSAGVSGMRAVLRTTVYASLLLLAAIALQARGGTAFLGSSIAITGTTLWALPYYGQNISYAPGDASIMLGLAGLIYARRKVCEGSFLAAGCSTFGAILTYFDYLTGQIPTGAGFLFAIVYVLSRDAGASTRRSWRLAFTALAAMAAGAVLTVVLKQAIVWSLAGSGGLNHFVNNAAFYTGLQPASESGPWLYIHAFRELSHYLFVLTPRVRLLEAASAAAWLIGLLHLARQHRLGDWGAFAVAALAVPAWVALMPRHTIQEAAFMIRICIVPVALSLALCLQALAVTTGVQVTSPRRANADV